jgi:ferritin-like metal-binding protein YciE
MKTKNATASRSSAATKKGSGNGSRGGGKSTSSASSRTSQSSATKSPTSRSQQASSSDATAQGLRDLFEDQLKDILWAEKALTKAIPKMIKNASSEELVTALEEHLAVTEEQVSRLEEVFGILGKAPRGKKCEAMEGLIKEGEEIMQSTEKGVVRDAGIIAAAQKVEHYEIATYGTLCSFAKTLGENEAADLLEQTLMEEKEADETLTAVAESSVNVEAAEEDEEGEEEEEEDTEEDEEAEEEEEEEE